MASMTTEEIEKAIIKLSPEERAKLRAWWEEFEADEWDRQIERDAMNGKLDKLLEESRADFREGRTRKF
jgi:hypothetical protein